MTLKQLNNRIPDGYTLAVNRNRVIKPYAPNGEKYILLLTGTQYPIKGCSANSIPEFWECLQSKLSCMEG